LPPVDDPPTVPTDVVPPLVVEVPAVDVERPPELVLVKVAEARPPSELFPNTSLSLGTCSEQATMLQPIKNR
jgi:hypothetical protein